MKRVVLVGVVAIGLLPAVAFAQAAPEVSKGYVGIYFGGQAGDDSFTLSSTQSIYDEPASITASQSYGGGPVFGIGAGVRVWKNLVIGGLYTRVQSDQDITVTASVPHPLFFERPRTGTISPADVEHEENAFHLQAKWVVPVGRRLEVSGFVGPSFFSISHGFAGAPIGVQEGTFPFDSVTVTTVNTASEKESAVGVNLGADAHYRLTDLFGVGGYLMFTRATTDITPAFDDDPIEITAGGFQACVGVRLAF